MKPDAADARRIEQVIRDLLGRRAAASSICPSDVARAITAGRDGWRAWMPAVRAVGFALQRRGLLVVTRGRAIVESDADGRGPIRLRRGPRFDG